MITAYFFCFLYAISATIGSVIFFGVSVRAVHAMLFVLFFTGLWILVFFGYSSIFHVAIGMIANFLMAGVFMLGGIYKGVHLDVSDKKAGWIFPLKHRELIENIVNAYLEKHQPKLEDVFVSSPEEKTNEEEQKSLF